jgi:hypothetical protein
VGELLLLCDFRLYPDLNLSDSDLPVITVVNLEQI